ncbi:NAD(P)-binding domain-containing protein [bacterium]|nr:NAD(P)-binding domain-containing protein [bacterium]
MNISFIGLGKLGLPCAEKIAEKGHIVEGYDIERKQTEHVRQRSTIEKAVRNADIVFVAVPTPHDPKYDGREPSHHLPPKDFDYTIVNEVLDECNKHMNKRQLLVLISTVLPGTVRREFVERTYNTKFLYNPYLIAMGTVAWDMVNPEMVMIGTEDGSETGDAKQLTDFYKTIMENDPRYVVGTWDECECIKVFYNTFISAKIGLVNMIQDVAQKQGNINVDVVTKALAESDHRIMSSAYMKAGMGDGGACHPRDNIALRYMAQELDLGYDLFAEIMKARDIQAKNMAKEILKHGNNIMFTSDSYKPGVDYKEGSYSLLVQHYVKELGGNIVNELPEVIVRVHPDDEISGSVEDVVVFDPWRGDADVRYGDTRCGI